MDLKTSDLLGLLVVVVQEMGELYTDLYILLSVSRRWESCTLTSTTCCQCPADGRVVH